MQHAVEDSDIVVVFAPTKDLVNQWVDGDNITRFFPESSIVRCLGDTNWRERLQNYLFTERSAPLFVVSTMHPSTMEDVIERVNSTRESGIAVIADEVHNLGSNLRRTIFPDLEADRARIALSATPFRDDPGDEAIIEYFGDTIHEISIEDAIEEYEVLSEYEYHIHSVVLSDSERKRFRDHSTEISHLYNTYKSYEDQSLIEVSDRHPDLKVEVMDRARIVKECSAKLDVTRSLIDEAGTRTLVYCNTEEHTEQVVEEVDDHTTKTVSIFLGRLPSSEKENLLTHFEGGKIDVLVSIDCLTEGIDVPECDSAILVTSSTTEREAVQRRGRILREAESDEPAHLYDFVTLPTDLEKIKAGEADLVPTEISLIKRELQRLRIMNADAANKMENDPRILRLARAITQYDPR
jgi:superfamily II DNA or RNA helicase